MKKLRRHSGSFFVIIVAGPSEMTESVRRALRSDVASPLAVLRGLPPVTLHAESFGMFKS